MFCNVWGASMPTNQTNGTPFCKSPATPCCSSHVKRFPGSTTAQATRFWMSCSNSITRCCSHTLLRWNLPPEYLHTRLSATHLRWPPHALQLHTVRPPPPQSSNRSLVALTLACKIDISPACRNPWTRRFLFGPVLPMLVLL